MCGRSDGSPEDSTVPAIRLERYERLADAEASNESPKNAMPGLADAEAARVEPVVVADSPWEKVNVLSLGRFFGYLNLSPADSASRWRWDTKLLVALSLESIDGPCCGVRGEGASRGTRGWFGTETGWWFRH